DSRACTPCIGRPAPGPRRAMRRRTAPPRSQTCRCSPPRRPPPNAGTSLRRSSARGTSLLPLPQGSEISNVEDAPTAVRGQLPLGLHAHPDPNLVLRHLAEVVHHPHLRRRAIEAHHTDEDRFGNSLGDRKSTRLNSSHQIISYAVFCL